MIDHAALMAANVRTFQVGFVCDRSRAMSYATQAVQMLRAGAPHRLARPCVCSMAGEDANGLRCLTVGLH